jgi:hypothetical protein
MLRKSQVSKTVCPAGLAVVVESGVWGVSIGISHDWSLGCCGRSCGNPWDSGVRGFYVSSFISLARLKSFVLSSDSISHHMSFDCILRRTSACQLLAMTFLILLNGELGCYRQWSQTVFPYIEIRAHEWYSTVFFHTIVIIIILIENISVII